MHRHAGSSARNAGFALAARASFPVPPPTVAEPHASGRFLVFGYDAMLQDSFLADTPRKLATNLVDRRAGSLRSDRTAASGKARGAMRAIR